MRLCRLRAAVATGGVANIVNGTSVGVVASAAGGRVGAVCGGAGVLGAVVVVVAGRSGEVARPAGLAGKVRTLRAGSAEAYRITASLQLVTEGAGAAV